MEGTYTIPRYPVLMNFEECSGELEFNTIFFNEIGYNLHTARLQSTVISSVAVLPFIRRDKNQTVLREIVLMDKWSGTQSNFSDSNSEFVCPEGNTEK